MTIFWQVFIYLCACTENQAPILISTYNFILQSLDVSENYFFYSAIPKNWTDHCNSSLKYSAENTVYILMKKKKKEKISGYLK